jgi:hypothetical protein
VLGVRVCVFDPAFCRGRTALYPRPLSSLLPGLFILKKRPCRHSHP